MTKTNRWPDLQRLEYEYLRKEETQAAPLPGIYSTDRDAFSFDGHRLSSLYRDPIETSSWLRKSICAADAASSLKKYSIPAPVAGNTVGGISA